VQRGAALSKLCIGCHGEPGTYHEGLPGPDLDGMWDRPIASLETYEYSKALPLLRKTPEHHWTPELMEQFLADPKRFAPGTKMEFQGLLNEADRKALVEYLKTSR